MSLKTGKSFIGYDSQQVKDKIDECKLNHEMKLKPLDETLTQLNGDSHKLRKKISELKNELEQVKKSEEELLEKLSNSYIDASNLVADAIDTAYKKEKQLDDTLLKQEKKHAQLNSNLNNLKEELKGILEKSKRNMSI